MNLDESGADIRERTAKECAQADLRKASCPDPQSSSRRPAEADLEVGREPLSWRTGHRRAA